MKKRVTKYDNYFNFGDIFKRTIKKQKPKQTKINTTTSPKKHHLKREMFC
jgi:hypothetical protein